MLLDCCLSCLSVCYIGVLWPYGWVDQDETWLAHVCCGHGRPSQLLLSSCLKGHMCYVASNVKLLHIALYNVQV